MFADSTTQCRPKRPCANSRSHGSEQLRAPSWSCARVTRFVAQDCLHTRRWAAVRPDRAKAAAAGSVFHRSASLISRLNLFAASASVPLNTLGVIASGAVCGVLSDICPTTMAELFPTYLRTTRMSIGFRLTTAIFGGFASPASETLVRLTGSFSSPSYDVIGASIHFHWRPSIYHRDGTLRA